jgi:Flp pilus assembly protein TadG
MRRTKVLTRNGGALIYVVVAMVAFGALMSLGVDLAHVRLVKLQLQFAADAAARSAITGMPSGAAVSNAISAAALQTVDGTAVVVQAGDVEQGTWSNLTFTPGGASPNAVRVTVKRTNARGNAVQLWWGGMIGKTHCNITVVSIASGKATPIAGFIGYNGIVMKNNTFFGSYDSRKLKNPTQGSAGSNARVGTNAGITGYQNDTLDGDAVLGSQSTGVSGVVMSGSNLYQPAALPTPTLPAWSPPAPATDLVVSSTTVMPGGSYWYNSMTLNADLTFSGPAVVYVNGNIVAGGMLAAASGVPGDLTIYQFGSNTFGDALVSGMTIVANVVAPNSDFVTKNNLDFYGSGVFNTITNKNNANFYYDTVLGPADGSPVVSTVK